MKELFYYLCLILLAVIVFEDYRYRAVSWILFPLLFISLLILSTQKYPFTIILDNVSFNFLFLLGVLLTTTIYFSLKKKKVINITNGFLGWGDVLFLLSISVLFSPLNYLVFYLGSLTIITLIYLLNKLFRSLAEDKIPLAGLQSLLLAGLLITTKFYPFINLTSDEWILNRYFNV